MIDEIQRVPELLPGRAETIELWPLSQGEIGSVADAGEQQLSFGDRLTALPMAALWTLDGSVS